MIWIILLIAIIVIAFLSTRTDYYASPPGKREILNQSFRSLWQQHVEWTRMLIVSIVSKNSDEAEVTTRLLRNVPDMILIFKKYYGDAISAQLEKLLHAHLTIGAEFIRKLAIESQDAIVSEREWYTNARDLANYLSQINPYWREDQFREMLFSHLKMTIQQILYRVSGKHAFEIQEYNKIETEALMMADAFANGISRQFNE
jgi:hypothetical protein